MHQSLPRYLALAVFWMFGLHAVSAMASCPPPPGYSNQIAIQDGDVLVSFATDQQVYLSGQPVRFFLSFENTGTEQVNFPCPYSPEYRIHVLPDSCLDYEEPGCDTLASTLPGFVYWYSNGIWLDPGECYSRTSIVWEEERPGFPPVPGVYRAFGGLPGYSEEFSVPTGGAPLLFIVGAPSGIEILPPGLYPNTWGRIKALYD
jgi:hypothetical protein